MTAWLPSSTVIITTALVWRVQGVPIRAAHIILSSVYIPLTAPAVHIMDSDIHEIIQMLAEYIEAEVSEIKKTKVA